MPSLTERNAEFHLVRRAAVGRAPALVRAWFDTEAVATKQENDGSLATAHGSAHAYRSRAKHGLIPLPGAPLDVAAFLAGRTRPRPIIAFGMS